MNTTGRKTVKAKASAAKSVKAVASNGTGMTAPSFDEISKRSYQLYLARGAEGGHEVEDWLAAESELAHK